MIKLLDQMVALGDTARKLRDCLRDENFRNESTIILKGNMSRPTILPEKSHKEKIEEEIGLNKTSQIS
jgi:hypothetical protein